VQFGEKIVRLMDPLDGSGFDPDSIGGGRLADPANGKKPLTAEKLSGDTRRSVFGGRESGHGGRGSLGPTGAGRCPSFGKQTVVVPDSRVSETASPRLLKYFS
jgi:hypothetical protein